MGKVRNVVIGLDDLITVHEAMKLLRATRQAVVLAWKTGTIAGQQLGSSLLLHRRSVLEYKQANRLRYLNKA
jgi:hypothetical protein